MRRQRTIALAFGLVAFSARLAQATDTHVIVVTATRTPAPVSTIGSSVSVLTSEDLRKLGLAYVDDALRSLPGVSVTQNGGPGGFSTVRIRGEEGYRTVVLEDGIRIDDPAGTQIATNFANLLVAGIAQIEVVRGPQSLLYGADAIGGVVQILTDKPQDGFHYRGEASAGAYHSYAASGSLLYGAPKFGLAFSAAHQQAEGFTEKVGDPDLGDADGNRVLALHGVVRAEPSEAFSLQGVVHYTEASAQFDGASASPAFPPFPATPADPDRVLKTKEIDARASVTHHGWDGVTTELAYAVMSSKRNDLSNGLPFGFGSKFDGDRQEASLISTIQVMAGETLLVGVDHMHVTAKTDSINESGTDKAIFGEWEWAIANQLYLTAGVRYDDDDQFGSHLSGRATAAWLPKFFTGEKTRFHGSYGTGFRAPSPFERATNRAASLPELNEEQSQGFDFGVSQSLLAQTASLDITFFEQTIEDEIRFDNVGFTGYFQSIGNSRSRGLEVSGQYRRQVQFGALSAVQLETAFTYTDSIVHSPDAENGLPRVRRPRYASASTLSFEFGEDATELALTLRTAAKTEDGFSSFRVPLDSYALLDVSARWKFTPSAEIFVSGTNVLNEQYEEVNGFATSDAAIFAGIRLRG